MVLIFKLFFSFKKINFCIFNEIVQKYVKYCKKKFKKKIEFFKKTQIIYEFLTIKNIKFILNSCFVKKF